MTEGSQAIKITDSLVEDHVLHLTNLVHLGGADGGTLASRSRNIKNHQWWIIDGQPLRVLQNLMTDMRQQDHWNMNGGMTFCVHQQILL